jgi:hypothetical protein
MRQNQPAHGNHPLGDGSLLAMSVAPDPEVAGYDLLRVSASTDQSLQGFIGLPGSELVSQGIVDLRRGDQSEEALLVSIGAPRLRSLGIELPRTIASPEHALYLRLAEERGDGAHSAYNALLRRLVSFERAASCVP